jgi:23S rRNA pseudouridine2605 synthase
MDSEGLLLLTDDGAATQRILHPSTRRGKGISGWVTGERRRALPILTVFHGTGRNRTCSPRRSGGPAGTGRVKSCPSSFTRGKNGRYGGCVRRRGLRWTRLKRIREGSLVLDEGLNPGQWRFLSKGEIGELGGFAHFFAGLNFKIANLS